MYKIGFTGTRRGMTPPQAEAFYNYLKGVYWTFPKDRIEFHHGDCAGADAQAHAHVATTYGLVTDIHIHPPISSSARAFCELRERPHGKRAMTLVTYPVKDYLERNHDIVDAVDLLIATPKEDQEVMRSGTWATIRYARKKLKPVAIFLPSGEVRFFPDPDR
jgi:hypothetical protein